MIRNKLDFFNSDGKNKNNHGYDQKETTILHYKVLKEKIIFLVLISYTEII